MAPKQITLTNVPDVVRNVSLFLKDLMGLVDRPTAIELVRCKCYERSRERERERESDYRVSRSSVWSQEEI